MRSFSTNDWVSVHAATWRRAFARFVGVAGVQALEIGSFEGRSACWFCDHVLTGPGAGITCIDSWETDWSGPAEEGWFDANVTGLPVTKIKGRSRDVLPRLAAEDKSYQIVYVDGDHRASACLFDCVLGWTLLKRGGVLVVDDYLWTDASVRIPPQAAVDGFVRSYRDQIRHLARTRSGQVMAWK